MPTVIKRITNDRDFVDITSDSLLNNTRVVVKSVKGDVMYDNSVTLVNGSNTIYVPERDDDEKYSIELYCGREYLFEKLTDKEYQGF